MTSKAKTIQLLLENGTLDGVITIVDSAWDIGEMYASPRESIDELLSTDSINKYGVYLLLSNDKVYIGQSQDLAKRIKQHDAKKLWWTKVVLLTTKEDSFNRAHIDYLESRLIKMAANTNSIDNDNKTKGNDPKIDKFDKVKLENYIIEALFLMQLIGISVFSEKNRLNKKKKEATLTIPPIKDERRKQPKAINNNKPSLPSGDLKIGKFVSLSMKNLSQANYIFSEEKLKEMATSKWSKEHFHTEKPFLRLIENGLIETRDAKGYVRFWATPLQFGDYTVLISKEWYERQRDLFVAWYESL